MPRPEPVIIAVLPSSMPIMYISFCGFLEADSELLQMRVTNVGADSSCPIAMK
jgi:hypothetical protein